MEKIKIVIELSKNEYDALDKLNAEYLLHIIKDGTPLPKGRLINADSMKTIKNIQSANFNAVESIRFWIDSQPTII